MKLGWDKRTEPDNDGKPMPVLWSRCGRYSISANVAVWEDGKLVRWDYELCVIEDRQECFLSEHGSLQEAKMAANIHAFGPEADVGNGEIRRQMAA
jgi:hypothetical protein